MVTVVRRHPRVRWTHALLSQLGEVDDASIAEPIGARIEQITDKRLALGIAPTAHDRLNPERWSLAQRRDLVALPAEQFCLLHSNALGITLSDIQQVAAQLIRLPRPAKIRWTAAMIRRLGSDIDSRVARRLGLTTKQVAYKRLTLRIPGVDQKSLTWTPARIALLGSKPDGVLARQWQLCEATVSTHRLFLGIPVYRPPSSWTPALDARLAWDLLASVAKAAGVSVAAARWRRKQLGLKGNRYRKRSRLWDPTYVRLLGTVSDRDLAHRWDVSLETVYRMRVALDIPAFRPASVWNPTTEALLSTMDDHVLARQLGVSIGTVSYRRRVLGIPGERNRRHRQFWSPERLEELRTTSSEVLSSRWSRHVKSIRRARVRFGIPEPSQA
jgi:hypothetical protein